MKRGEELGAELYSHGGFLLSDIQKIVLKNLKYFYLWVANFRALMGGAPRAWRCHHWGTGACCPSQCLLSSLLLTWQPRHPPTTCGACQPGSQPPLHRGSLHTTPHAPHSMVLSMENEGEGCNPEHNQVKNLERQGSHTRCPQRAVQKRSLVV